MYPTKREIEVTYTEVHKQKFDLSRPVANKNPILGRRQRSIRTRVFVAVSIVPRGRIDFDRKLDPYQNLPGPQYYCFSYVGAS